MTDPDLVHFVNAQTKIYEQVVRELTGGTKRTHWMWFIFPQLVGLGHSVMAQRFAIRDLDQARRYLADPVLGARLRHDVQLMLQHKDKSALEILGSPDDLKFRSCLTLFSKAASNDIDSSLFMDALPLATCTPARSSCYGKADSFRSGIDRNCLPNRV